MESVSEGGSLSKGSENKASPLLNALKQAVHSRCKSTKVSSAGLMLVLDSLPQLPTIMGRETSVYLRQYLL